MRTLPAIVKRPSEAPRRLSYRQVFARSFLVVAAAYTILGFLAVFEPGRQMEPFERSLVPVLLVGTPIVALVAAAPTALALTTVWWFCRAAWRPHASDVPTGTRTDPRSI